MHRGDKGCRADLETVNPKYCQSCCCMGGVDTVLPGGYCCCCLEDDDTDQAGENEGTAAELIDDVGAEQSEDEVYGC